MKNILIAASVASLILLSSAASAATPQAAEDRSAEVTTSPTPVPKVHKAAKAQPSKAVKAKPAHRKKKAARSKYRHR